MNRRALAWGVHFYTALGAPIGLASMHAAVQGDARAAFLWMCLAVFLDATDGFMARTVRVKEVLPDFDGSKLDDIVDYFTFVVVPIFFALETNMLPEGWGLWVAAVPLVASGYQFCQGAAKTSDFFFTGFPSYWNIVVFYAYGLDFTPAVTTAWLLGFSVLVFVPIGYVYPTRQPFLRPWTIGLGGVWGAIVVAAAAELPDRASTLLRISLLYVVYYFALSIWLQLRRKPVAELPAA